MILIVLTTGIPRDYSLEDKKTEVYAVKSKLWLGVFVLLAGALILFYVAGHQRESARRTPMATALEPINVRSGPGKAYESYGVASIGDTAEIIGVSADGSYWVVKISTDIAPDGRGWVPAARTRCTASVRPTSGRSSGPARRGPPVWPRRPRSARCPIARWPSRWTGRTSACPATAS